MTLCTISILRVTPVSDTHVPGGLVLQGLHEAKLIPVQGIGKCGHISSNTKKIRLIWQPWSCSVHSEESWPATWCIYRIIVFIRDALCFVDNPDLGWTWLWTAWYAFHGSTGKRKDIMVSFSILKPKVELPCLGSIHIHWPNLSLDYAYAHYVDHRFKGPYFINISTFEWTAPVPRWSCPFQ